MNCDEMLKALNAYVDGETAPGMCEELQKHLADCNPCQVVVDNIRKTITLYKNGQPYELPAAIQTRLHQCLRDKWKERFETGRANRQP